MGRFVLISTDKAVNPTNVMVATKRLCEMIVQALAQKSKNQFVAVLPQCAVPTVLFPAAVQRADRGGGPVTVTHPDIWKKRFGDDPRGGVFVALKAAMGNGGDIVLDMGNPVKILDLAENPIKLSGFIPYRDIETVHRPFALAKSCMRSC